MSARLEGEQRPVETEKKPRYIQMITRHAERLPVGKLSPEGVAHAQEKGRQLHDQAEVLKAYASDHVSGRAFDTAEQISQMSEIKSPLTGKQYGTKKIKTAIQYDVLKPDLYEATIPKAKQIIEEATLQEIYSNKPDVAFIIDSEIAANPDKILVKKYSDGRPMPDIEKLSEDTQKKIANIRQSFQPLGFDYILRMDRSVNRMAMGLANELVRQQPVIARYADKREKAGKRPEKDVILNTATHGMFVESLLKEAGVLVASDGSEIHGISDFKSIGGYIMPAESIYLNIGDPANIPARIPVKFEGGHRPAEGVVFIDREKLLALAEDYKNWKQNDVKK